MSMTASVVSAAILEGNLIIGLSDGSVINCGYVQGPPGLKGDPGPMGADGDAGRDGNTIITVAGTPRNDAGKDGDYAIDNVNWRIYGPKSGGTWGKANEMLPSKENLIVNGRGFEGGAGGSGDSGGGGGGGEGIRVIRGGPGITATEVTSSLSEVAADIDTDRGMTFASDKIAINIGDGLEFDAATGKLKTSIDLDEYAKITYVDSKTAPLPYRIETDKVTREGKEIRSGEPEIQLVDNDDNFTNIKFTGSGGIGVASNVQGIEIDGSEFATKGQLITIEEELEQLAPSLERGTWTFTTSSEPGVAQYTLVKEILTKEQQEQACVDAYTQCMVDAGGDPAAGSECNRVQSQCDAAVVDTGKLVTTNVFAEAGWILFNPEDTSGTTHDWGAVTDEHLIDVFNESDEGYVIGEIDSHADGLFKINLVQSKGTATGLASVKIFKVEGADPTNYVRKTGDTITGPIVFNPETTGNPVTINANDNSDSRSIVFSVRGKTQEDGNRKSILHVVADGRVLLDSSNTLESNSAVPRSYVDFKANKPANFSWKLTPEKTGDKDSVVPDNYVWNSKKFVTGGSEFRFSLKPYNGDKIKSYTGSPYKIVINSASPTQPILTCWYWDANESEWKWKGTAAVEELDFNPSHIYARLASSGFSSGDGMNDKFEYYFTIAGFF